MTSPAPRKIVLLGLFGFAAACSFLSEIKAKQTGPAIVLDEATTAQRTRIRVCYEGMHAESLDLQLTANSTGPARLAGDDGSAPEMLSSTNTDVYYDLLGEQGLTFASACDTGMIFLFSTQDPSGTPAISWSVEAVATQTDGDEIYGDTITVSIELLPPA